MGHSWGSTVFSSRAPHSCHAFY
ncbi:unnamed protein product [Spirodela intermedia]|uniref:Uncharacterized protein n=1 Tax=Spirodela intermedia TaxID=51605 RepID=A0A7I8K1G0_SPIIN|nr:unnamed protein product [Spirodela intermedia]